MFSVYAAERIDIFEGAIFGQRRVMTDEDLRKIGNGAARFAEVLVILWRRRIGRDICVRVRVIVVGRILFLIDKFESLSLRVRTLLLSRCTIFIQDR